MSPDRGLVAIFDLSRPVESLPKESEKKARRHRIKFYCKELREWKKTPGLKLLITLWNKFKSEDIDLEPTSEYETSIWQEFLQVGVKNKGMLQELWGYALGVQKRKGHMFPGTYQTIVSHYLLEEKYPLAYHWHKEIKANAGGSDSDVTSLISTLALNPALSRLSHEILQVIYKESNQRNLYDLVMPLLCAHAPHRAFRWHQILLEIGDFPTPATAKSPQILAMLRGRWEASLAVTPDQIVTDTSETSIPNDTRTSSEETRDQQRGQVAASPQLDRSREASLAATPDRLDTDTSETSIPDDTETSSDGSRDQQRDQVAASPRLDWSREAMNRHLGNIHGIAEKKVDDKLCARLFATKIFPINTIISGLGMIGADALGPTSMRELVVRASDREEFLQNLKALKESKISIMPCVYSNLLMKGAREDAELFKSMVNTDQHPDVFEDIELQHKLLHSYVISKDWLQIYRTLKVIAILQPVETAERSPNSVETTQPSKNSVVWNYVLTSNNSQSRDRSVKYLLDQLLVHRVPIETSVLEAVRQKFLKSYHPRRPDLHPDDEGNLVAVDPIDLCLAMNFFLRTHISTNSFSPFLWRGVLQRLGLLGRYQELARLSVWLTTIYSPKIPRWAPGGGVISRPASEDLVAPNPTDHMPGRINLLDKELKTKPLLDKAGKKVVPLDIIFSLHTQFSIVAWGFLGLLPRAEPTVAMKSADWYSNEEYPDLEWWACGIKLLKELQERGAPIRTKAVRGMVVERLWMLFGTARFTRWENRQAKLRNPYTLLHMVNHVTNYVWPGLFDDLAPFLLENRASRARDLFHTIFRKQLRKREKFWERVGRRRMLLWGSPFRTYRKRLQTRPKLRRLSSVKGVKQPEDPWIPEPLYSYQD
ncbi:MAG: hypothetical protein M1822_006990 [Bathelium mastoideum]|nr:MAG: hypothetical protein M1822_006990 [Bathelium mastoideum]